MHGKALDRYSEIEEELYKSLKNLSFANDIEKMRDFDNLSKEEFLSSYSYLTEEAYDATARELSLKGVSGKEQAAELLKLKDFSQINAADTIEMRNFKNNGDIFFRLSLNDNSELKKVFKDFREGDIRN